jgi:hypothetical protein
LADLVFALFTNLAATAAAKNTSNKSPLFAGIFSAIILFEVFSAQKRT